MTEGTGTGVVPALLFALAMPPDGHSNDNAAPNQMWMFRPSNAATDRLPTSASPEWVRAVLEKIRGFIGPGYPSSYGTPPSDWTVTQAEKIARHLAQCGIRPNRVIPMADGGIAFLLSTELRTARVEITNDEEVVVTTAASPEDKPTYEE